MSMFELEELTELRRMVESRTNALKMAARDAPPHVGVRLHFRIELMRNVAEKLDAAIITETRIKKKGTYEQSSEKEEES